MKTSSNVSLDICSATWEDFGLHLLDGWGCALLPDGVFFLFLWACISRRCWFSSLLSSEMGCSSNGLFVAGLVIFGCGE